EARIGWMTATGDPARPVTLAGADQYRKLFRWPDFIRRLLETADYELAHVPPDRPKLLAAFPGSFRVPDGPLITREPLHALVTFDDRDRARNIARAELRWQVIGPDGASEWFRAPFEGGQAQLPLADRAWKRGAYAVHAKLFLMPYVPPEAVVNELMSAVF